MGVLLTYFSLAGVQPALSATAQETTPPPVVVIELDGVIDSVSERYLGRAIGDANDNAASVIVVELDTPGGRLYSTRTMVGDILASDVPVVVYVSPVGAQAASAGTYISAASSWLAMAPGTNIGAASVVGSGGEDLPDTLSKKVTEDTTAFMRSIAAERDRPAEPLEQTVTDATAYSAGEAVELGIADEMATSLEELLISLDGRTLPGASGPIVVVTDGAEIDHVGMNLFEKILSFISNPNVAFLFISLGTIAIIAEIYTAGLGIAGILGATALIVGFAGVGNLPFSWAGIALLAASVVLFALEAQAPGFGIFGTAGIVTLILGGIFVVGFFGSPDLVGGSPSVNRWVLIGVAIFVGLMAMLIGREIRKSKHDVGYVSPYADENLLGALADVRERLDPSGAVMVAGERWDAELVTAGVAEVGERVRVAERRENCLLVEPEPASIPPLEHPRLRSYDQT